MRRFFAKWFQLLLIVMIIYMAALTALLAYASRKNDQYLNEYQEQLNQNNIADEDQEYGRKVDKPLYYHVLVDTRRSMPVNFDDFENHMKDELIEMAALLTKKDYLALYMMNEDKVKIILSGKTAFEENAQMIRDLEFSFDDAADVDRTLKLSEQDFKDLQDAYYTRRIIVTDRSAAELSKNEIGREKSVHWANMTDIVVSDSNMVSNYNLLDEIYFAHTLGENDSFIENIIEDEFYFAYTKLERFSVATENDQINDFGIYGKLPQKTDRLVVILSEEDMLLVESNYEKATGDVYGTTLSDGRRVLVMNFPEAYEDYALSFNYGQSGTLIYASDNGYPLESLEYSYLDPEWETEYYRWGIGYLWRTDHNWSFYPTSRLGHIDHKDVMKAGIILAGLIFLLIMIKLAGKYRQKKLRLKRNVFISYRRSGTSLLAHSINDQLRNRGIQTFMDIENLSSGDFEAVIKKSLKESACMVLVLPEDGLNACLYHKDDWIRKEVSLALQYGIPIVPVLVKGFIWPKKLPAEMAKLPSYNAIYFDEQLNYKASMEHVIGFVMNELENHGMEFNHQYEYDEEEVEEFMDEEFYSYFKSRSEKDSKGRKNFLQRMIDILEIEYDEEEPENEKEDAEQTKAQENDQNNNKT